MSPSISPLQFSHNTLQLTEDLCQFHFIATFAVKNYADVTRLSVACGACDTMSKMKKALGR